MRNFLACLLATLGMTTACGQQNFDNKDVDGFAAFIDSVNVVLLDVRTVQEYQEGHLEGALNIDQSKGDFLEQVKTILPLDKKIAVYCRSGRRSTNAANRLAAMGYKCVNLKGGILAWQKAGHTVVE